MTYLSRARLWKVRNDDDLLGCCKRSNDSADLENKLLRERSFVVLVIFELPIAAAMVNVRLDRKIFYNSRFEGNEGVDSLSSDFVCSTDHWAHVSNRVAARWVALVRTCSFGDTSVQDQRRFDLCS